jgi:3-hydroxyacyl-CoA dehydrogenase
VKFKQPEGFVFLKDLRGTKKEVSKNAGASLFDIGDGVGLVEFHTKMNALDDDIFTIATEALDRLDTDFDGLVVGNEGEHFSAGRNCSWLWLGRSRACGIRSMRLSASCRT